MACSVSDHECCLALESGVISIATGNLFTESFFDRMHSVNVYEMAAYCSGGYNIQNLEVHNDTALY
jgi:hypothetical protein